MDDIVADTRREVEVLLAAWQTQGAGSAGMFRPARADGTITPVLESQDEYHNGAASQTEASGLNQVRFVLNDMSGGDDNARLRPNRKSKNLRPESPRGGCGGSDDYFSSEEGLNSLHAGGTPGPQAGPRLDSIASPRTLSAHSIGTSQDQGGSTGNSERNRGKKVAWGSIVGENDGGVFEAPF